MKQNECKPNLPEIFIGLVGPVGTDLPDLVTNALKDALHDVGYSAQEIHLSRELEPIYIDPRTQKELKSAPENVRIEFLMNMGDKFRRDTKDKSAVAIHSITRIRRIRKNRKNGLSDKPVPSQAYILRSLKRPEEVSELRKIYRDRFILISAYSSGHLRLQKLTYDIATSNYDSETDKYKKHAQYLIHRDQFDHLNKKWGQKVRDTFDKADLFIDASVPDRSKLKSKLTSFFELFLGNIFRVPTLNEYAMFHAYGCAARSSSASRRVGAVIMTDEGDIIAVGTNEVPKAGGGLYGPDDDPDYRDFKIGYDTNTRKIRVFVGDFLKSLDKKGYLKTDKTIDKLVDMALSGKLNREVQLRKVIEFMRPVHAEEAALLDAARRTISVKDCTLFTTDFPCHICAKHIIAAGIKRVVYIRPYPKSIAQELFFDSMTVDSLEKGDHTVKFESFVGIAPSRYLDLFHIDDVCDEDWKTRDGRIILWDISRAKVELDEEDKSYTDREHKALMKQGKNISNAEIFKMRLKVKLQV